MILEIPTELTSVYNPKRHLALIKQSNARWGRRRYDRQFDSPAEVAGYYGCEEFKKADWYRVLAMDTIIFHDLIKLHLGGFNPHAGAIATDILHTAARMVEPTEVQ